MKSTCRLEIECESEMATGIGNYGGRLNNSLMNVNSIKVGRWSGMGTESICGTDCGVIFDESCW